MREVPRLPLRDRSLSLRGRLADPPDRPELPAQPAIESATATGANSLRISSIKAPPQARLGGASSQGNHPGAQGAQQGTTTRTSYLRSASAGPARVGPNFTDIVENEGRTERSLDFGALLRSYRLTAGLSQETLAERAGMSAHGISALERGYRRTPQRGTLALLAGALALSDAEGRKFEAAAARSLLLGGRSRASITVGPWADTRSSNLPIALTSFIGRGVEIEEIASLLRDHRLVTLTGAGGIGKTQIGLHVATTLRDDAGTAVCFVPLAPIRDASLVATAIALALGIQEAPNRPLLETLVAYLKNKALLLIFDNCEHVIAEAAIVADRLLRACLDLRILATSREPLRAGGERAYRLPSLDKDDAIALFADRAQAAHAHFTVTDENGPTIRKICQHLSGIPLAIELAAARVAVLPVRTLAKALEDRFQVLEGGERTAPQRHQTMRAAIDWSYELLTAPEQRLFERLSIFAGGCTIDTATCVCPDIDLPGDDVQPLISSLVSKSLVVADLEGHEPRYHLLEPFREYAREKLKRRGDEPAVARRHVAAYLDLAEYHATARGDQHYTIHYEHGRNEIGNWRAAVRWALTERNDVPAGQRLVAEVTSSWGDAASVFSDARRWIPVALDLVDEQTPPDVIAKVKHADAFIAMHLRDRHQVQLASALEAIAYYRLAKDELRLVRAIDLAGGAFNDFGRNAEARAILEEGLKIASKHGIRWHVAIMLRSLAQVCTDEGDFAAARGYLTETLRVAKALDDRFELEGATLDLAELTYREGDPESAARQLTDVLAKGFSPYYTRRRAVSTQVVLSEYLIALDRYEEAHQHAQEALAAAREEHFDAFVARSLEILATIAVLRGASHDPDMQGMAARVRGFAEALLTTLGVEPIRNAQHDRVFATLRGTLGADGIATLIAEGATMTEDEAVEAATAL
jgi:predicted ATPase/DNA-binding XRE family transcriptional regulator